MKPFQVALGFIFGALALIAVFIFATFSGGDRGRVGDVAVWGSVPKEVMEGVLRHVTSTSDGYEGVEYREINETALIPTLVEAIASGNGPDLLLFPASAVVSQGDKISLIPYQSLSRREFQDAFVEAGEIFLSERGIIGLPFYIDPYVMYWNRTLFSNAGVARPPRYWDEVESVAPKLTKATESGTLTQSAAALGQWNNVPHAKEILLALLYGLGNRVVTVGEKGKLEAALTARGEGDVPPAEAALRFFTEFADPVQPAYSWNRSQPSARNAFLAGTLALYFAPASEILALRAGNPNLNFDVAPLPQVRGGRVGVPANVIALSIPRGARNVEGALKTAALLSDTDVQKALRDATSLPSVRRDISDASPENPYEAVFRDAALNAFFFYDPDPAGTDELFGRMVEDVASGRSRIPEAVRGGQSELQALLGVQ